MGHGCHDCGAPNGCECVCDRCGKRAPSGCDCTPAPIAPEFGYLDGGLAPPIKKKTRRTRKRPPAKPEPPPYPRIFETFRDPLEGSYEQRHHLSPQPSCFNGGVRIRRYEITIRRVEEPVEVLRERLLRLWHTSERNHHSWDPMWSAARDLGIQNPREFLIIDEQGRDRKK